MVLCYNMGTSPWFPLSGKELVDLGTMTLSIVRIADQLCKKHGTRDPYELADALGIHILYRPFKEQKGAYQVILGNFFIFLKEGMDDALERIVLLHEIGHHVLHRKMTDARVFQEFNIFNMRENRMEYEANIFAAQISLPDEEVLAYIRDGYDIQQIACEMNSDINLVALKNDTLIAQGYRFYRQDHQSNFLRYDK